MLLRRVVGESMLPALGPGKIVIALKFKDFAVGDVVFARLGNKEVIKRIASINEQGYFLVGDNSVASTDSRTKGSVAKSDIFGRVVWPRI